MAYIHDYLNDCNRNDFMTVRAKEGMYTNNNDGSLKGLFSSSKY
jgi:hypothetical protein